MPLRRKIYDNEIERLVVKRLEFTGAPEDTKHLLEFFDGRSIRSLMLKWAEDCRETLEKAGLWDKAIKDRRAANPNRPKGEKFTESELVSSLILKLEESSPLSKEYRSSVYLFNWIQLRNNYDKLADQLSDEQICLVENMTYGAMMAADAIARIQTIDQIGKAAATGRKVRGNEGGKQRRDVARKSKRDQLLRKKATELFKEHQNSSKSDVARWLHKLCTTDGTPLNLACDGKPPSSERIRHIIN